MIKNICKDISFLSKKSIPATKEDIEVAKDLLDTIIHHKNGCVGMAANMIGINKRIIVAEIDEHYCVFINPVLLSHSKEYYFTSEGCLSLDGTRQTKRYNKIKISYIDINMKNKIKTFDGFEAQIIQHELDHLEGIII